MSMARAQRASPRLHSIPEATGKPAHVSKSLLLRDRDAAARGQERRGSVIVRPTDEPLASYRRSIARLAATPPQARGTARLDARSTESQRYLAHLASRHLRRG